MSEANAESESRVGERIVERIANLTHQTRHFHKRIIEETGGFPGVRDEGALSSALAAPFATFGGESLHGTTHDKAAALMRSLSQNHPFVDGNKRVSLAMMELFLFEHGLGIKSDVGDDEIFSFCVAVAKGTLKVGQISDWLKSRTDRTTSRDFSRLMIQLANGN